MSMSFREYVQLSEMNVPGVHLDGKGGFAHPSTLQTGSYLSSLDTGSEDWDKRLNILPSLDLVARRLPKILQTINGDTTVDDNASDIPICPGMEYLAQISPKAKFWGRVSYVNGVPLPRDVHEPEAPKRNIEISFQDEGTGRTITLRLTLDQYRKVKDLNAGGDIELGMRIGVLMQRTPDDFRQELPWGKRLKQTTPNNSNILGVRYYKVR
jgi:hypothetical protein